MVFPTNSQWGAQLIALPLILRGLFFRGACFFYHKLRHRRNLFASIGMAGIGVHAGPMTPIVIMSRLCRGKWFAPDQWDPCYTWHTHLRLLVIQVIWYSV